jgi:hypothetical protein
MVLGNRCRHGIDDGLGLQIELISIRTKVAYDRLLTLSITRVDSTVEKYVVGSMSVLMDTEVTVAVLKSVAVAVET